MTTTVRKLGPFELVAPFARGGMGEIWRAVHRSGEQTTPVAIKVITARGTHGSRFRRMFQAEVEAVARLDHPHVVPVFDAGSVELGAGLDARVGAPWLAMELLEGGTLSTRAGTLPWPRLRQVLLMLLDGLAHAHARGLLHLDVKPANVLVGENMSTVKLADFGLARLQGLSPERPDRVAGTPHYMAPEQVTGAWRAWGPWTDLYALGCVAYELASGQPPFHDVGDARAVMSAQVRNPHPPLEARMAVPPEFEAWLGRLLDKRPPRRFRFAADAAWALARIPRLAPSGSTAPTGGFVSDESTRPPTLAVQMEVAQSGAPAADPDATQPARHRRRTTGPVDLTSGAFGQLVDSPPIPATWRRAAHWHPRLQLLGAGLGLFGVRELPIVGRNEERTRLWDALLRVCRDRKPQVVLLRGPAGLGKSRLATWLTERAHELGVALPLRAVHDPVGGPDHGLVGGPDHGLVGMLRHHLRCSGVTGQELLDRLRSFTRAWPDRWTHEELEALASYLEGGSDQTGGLSAKDRHAQINRTLRRAGWGRPVVVLLEGLQWGPDSRAWAQALVEQRPAMPVLIVATVDEEELGGDDPGLAQLAEHRNVETIDLGPLVGVERRHMIRDILGLRGDLASPVAERTAGNPLFAIQLVTELVRRGDLVPQEFGFALAPGATLQLGGEFDEFWLSRVDLLVRACRVPSSAELEIAAVLGNEFGESELATVCSEAGIERTPGLFQSRAAGLLVAEDASGSRATFVHPQLRLSLLSRAERSGDLQRWHRAAAAALRSHPSTADRERRAAHLAAAGDADAALDQLLDCMRDRLRVSRFDSVSRLISAWQRVCAEADLDASDVRLAEGELFHSEALRVSKGFADGAHRARRAEQLAADLDRLDLVARALVVQSRCAHRLGQAAEARALGERAYEVAERSGDRPMFGYASWFLGSLLGVHSTDRERAISILEAALADPDCEWGSASDGAIYQCLGHMAVFSGRKEEGLQLLHRALAAVEEADAPGPVAQLSNDIGALQCELGRYEEAETWLERATRGMQALGLPAAYPLANLGVVLIEQGRVEKAEVLLTQALEQATLERQTWFHGEILIDLARCAALRKQWERFDELLLRARTHLEAHRCADPDLPNQLVKAGDLAADDGAHESARAAWRLAAVQLRQLAADEEAAELEARAAGSD